MDWQKVGFVVKSPPANIVLAAYESLYICGDKLDGVVEIGGLHELMNYTLKSRTATGAADQFWRETFSFRDVEPT